MSCPVECDRERRGVQKGGGQPLWVAQIKVSRSIKGSARSGFAHDMLRLLENTLCDTGDGKRPSSFFLFFLHAIVNSERFSQ